MHSNNIIEGFKRRREKHVSFMIICRNPPSVIERHFYTREEAYTFAKIIHLANDEFEIVTEQEVQEYMQEQELFDMGFQQENDLGAYTERLPHRGIVSRYHPGFVRVQTVRPNFVNSRKKK
jgi:hypothetical protein